MTAATYGDIVFRGDLDIREHSKSGKWWEVISTHAIIWRGGAVEIPAGFVTDLASIPWWALWLLPTLGPWNRAAVAHDKLYKARTGPQGETGKPGRARADRFFYDVMKARGVAWWRRWAIYGAVRIGGGKAWQKGGK